MHGARETICMVPCHWSGRILGNLDPYHGVDVLWAHTLDRWSALSSPSGMRGRRGRKGPIPGCRLPQQTQTRLLGLWYPVALGEDGSMEQYCPHRYSLWHLPSRPAGVSAFDKPSHQQRTGIALVINKNLHISSSSPIAGFEHGAYPEARMWRRCANKHPFLLRPRPRSRSALKIPGSHS
ncbi:hypothetical protein FIBSPDRAFT_59899 [Athelia psychrophila]|uniref:Uncharacterized protein n=1 Tax=Athelia psychrophila TaxID=1759441 RepID=A0A166F4N0_9AGAM|nr:hypothetical protein FIBSPDRAFT_59899 [Fibularhizoctonia sp. CBS 109695]